MVIVVLLIILSFLRVGAGSCARGACRLFLPPTVQELRPHLLATFGSGTTHVVQLRPISIGNCLVKVLPEIACNCDAMLCEVGRSDQLGRSGNRSGTAHVECSTRL